jgi:flagellar protein FliS
MFASAHGSSHGASRSGVNAYRQIRVETDVSEGSPHRLVAMLYDGFFEALAKARGHMRKGEIELKGRAIGHAARIVEEGLKAGLDLSAGPMAADLRDLYGYVIVRLMHANLRNDEAALDECVSLMEPLRSAWSEIGTDAQNAIRK